MHPRRRRTGKAVGLQVRDHNAFQRRVQRCTRGGPRKRLRDPGEQHAQMRGGWDVFRAHHRVKPQREELLTTRLFDGAIDLRTVQLIVRPLDGELGLQGVEQALVESGR